MSIDVSDLFQATVEKLIFGGSGLVRLQNGMVAQIPYVIPQETVTGRIVKVFRSYALAEIDSIVHPSPDRIPPRCPHFGVCGGCQIQHIAYERHGEIKKGWLQEALFHALPPAVTVQWSPSTSIWHWRKKIVLHARRHKNGIALGYFAKDSKTLISCSECPIFFHDSERKVIDGVKEALSVSPLWREGDVLFFRRSPTCIAVHFFLDTALSDKEREQITKLLSLQGSIEEVIEHRGKKERVLFSKKKNEEFHLSFHGVHFRYSEQAFIQTHPEQPFLLWEDFCTHMKTWPSQSHFLDLYSGIGVTATLAAKNGHSVTSVELSHEAVQACLETKKIESLDTLRCLESSVESFLHSKAYLNTPWHAILINPPRQGLSREVLENIALSKASELHYISCHPATLRRDLMRLSQAGWQIAWVKGYDMFPQTAHFETYVTLRRSS